MSRIDIPVVRPWSLKIPKVVRYMETRFIEDFFEHGKLMLTTYSRCKNHEDDTRKDVNEGKCNFALKQDDNVIAGIQEVGFQSYMLCTSMIESEKLMLKFSTDNYFWINDILRFSDAISRYIPGFTNGKIGACIYKDQRTIDKATITPTIPENSPLLQAVQSGNYQQIEAEFYRMQRNLANSIDRELADEPFFLKESHFSEEAEVRIVWGTPHQITGPLHITCPEAIQFCSPGIPLSKEFNKVPQISSDSKMSVLIGKSGPLSDQEQQ